MKKLLLILVAFALCVTCHSGIGVKFVEAEGIVPETLDLKEAVPKSFDVRNKSSTQVCGSDALPPTFIGNINLERNGLHYGLDPTSTISEGFAVLGNGFHRGLDPDFLRADGTEEKTVIARSFSGNVGPVYLLSG